MELSGFGRYLRALWRDTRVLVRQFRWSLLAFAALIVIGGLCLHFFYVAPEGGQRGISWGWALHATFSMVFLENTLEFPEHPWFVQMLFFAVPVMGVAVVADSIIRFGVALFNRYERKEAWQVAIASTYHDHVIVCGLGRLGYRVVKQLLKLGEEVVGIEQNPENAFLAEVQQMHVPVLLLDARQPESLEKANVRAASAIVVCTEDDLANLDIALDARELHPGIKVVLRMFDSTLAERVQRGFGIHTAFSTSALAAPLFAAAATRTQVDYSFDVDGIPMHVARASIASGSALEGRTVGQLEQEFDLAVTLHKRADTCTFHPAEDIVLQAGDMLVLLASLESLTHLRGFSESSRDSEMHQARAGSGQRPPRPDR